MKKIDKGLLLKTALPRLLSWADTVRRDCTDGRLELCGILNAKSGSCAEDCKFCAQSSRNISRAASYPLMDKAEIVKAAGRVKDTGAARFGIVTSGNRLSAAEVDTVAEAVSLINSKKEISVCASLGALDKGGLKRLRDAGLCRYHHNIETSPRFYPHIVSTHSFRERLDTIEFAKSAGLEVCSGGIIGMGESWQDRIDMASLLKELEVDSVPLNILVPVRGTPLESGKAIPCADAIRTICGFRLILRDKDIKIAAGRESVLKDFQALGFMAGANGMLIGGYLTTKGRDVREDHKLAEEIQRLWNG